MRHHDPGAAVDNISAYLHRDPIALAGSAVINSGRGQLRVKYFHHGSQRAQACRNWNAAPSIIKRSNVNTMREPEFVPGRITSTTCPTNLVPALIRVSERERDVLHDSCSAFWFFWRSALSAASRA